MVHISLSARQRTQNTVVYSIHVSQGSVAMRLRCGGIFNDTLIANCLLSVPVKELRKSVNIWQKYGQKFGGTFFMVHGVFSE